MDKKNLPLLILIVAVLGVGGGYYYLNNKDDKTGNTTSQTQTGTTQNPAITDACAKFTLEDAKQVIGDGAKSDSSVSPGVSSDDANVTTCTYSITSELSATGSVQTASLLIRSPKTQPGVVSNQTPFNEGKPATATDVSGVGDMAYWNPELGQLNVLIKDNWLIITAGPTKPSERTQDQAVEAANLIVPKI